MLDNAFVYDLPRTIKIKEGLITKKLVFKHISWAQEEDKLKIRELMLIGADKFQTSMLKSLEYNPLFKGKNIEEIQQEIEKLQNKEITKNSKSEQKKSSEENFKKDSTIQSLLNTNYKMIANILFSNGYIKARLDVTSGDIVDVILNEDDLNIFMDNLEESTRLDILAGWVIKFLS